MSTVHYFYHIFSCFILSAGIPQIDHPRIIIQDSSMDHDLLCREPFHDHDMVSIAHG